MIRVRFYNGISSAKKILVPGRLEKYWKVREPKEADSIWRNLNNMFRTFLSKGLKNKKLIIYAQNHLKEIVTDDNGYFTVEVERNKLKPSLSDYTTLFHKIEILGLSKNFEIDHEKIIDFSDSLSHIVVSDIDDTFLVSHSTSFFKKIQLLFFKNIFTREIFKGIREQYKDLHKQGDVPFFYVSSSEWNLYDMLKELVIVKQLPPGVFLLRKSPFTIFQFWKTGRGDHSSKHNQIQMLLDFFPKAKFSLIGDNSQSDPKIYKEIALLNPERIKEIRLRIVKSWKENVKEDYIRDLLPIDVKYITTY